MFFSSSVGRPLSGRCSVVVQSNTEQRLNNDRTTGGQLSVGQRFCAFLGQRAIIGRRERYYSNYGRYSTAEY